MAPKAAKNMEKQFAQMRKMMAEQMASLRKQADVDFSKMGGAMNPVIQKFPCLAQLMLLDREYW